MCQRKLVFVSSFFTVWSPGIKGDGSRGGKNFIFKSERRHICPFNIAPHIKALIKRSAGRLLLLWPEEIFVGGESWWWCVPRPCYSWLRSYFTELARQAASPVSQLSQSCVSVAPLLGLSYAFNDVRFNSWIDRAFMMWGTCKQERSSKEKRK